MYSTAFGATGVGTQLPMQYPNSSGLNIPEEMVQAGYHDLGTWPTLPVQTARNSGLNLPEELWEAGYSGLGQDGARMSGGTALLVTGLVAAGAAGVGVFLGWLAERRQGKRALAGFGAAGSDLRQENQQLRRQRAELRNALRQIRGHVARVDRSVGIEESF